MLNLNPDDNQGARYMLAAYLAEAARDEDLALLLAEYPEEWSAVWSWTAALIAFRRIGADDESNKLLAAAQANNRHVLPYLLGERRLPEQMPPYMSPGDEDEAIYYVSECRAGWALTPGAIDWLRAQAPALKSPPRRPHRSKLQ
jgi:hypothetical protein